jgi:hypothetical protein
VPLSLSSDAFLFFTRFTGALSEIGDFGRDSGLDGRCSN